MALLKMEIIQVRNQPMKFKPSFVIFERKPFEMKRMKNHPYYVNCNIPANDSIQYNVLFCESRAVAVKKCLLSPRVFTGLCIAILLTCVAGGILVLGVLS